MKKIISVIMPVKNGEKYLGEAIDGIKRQEQLTDCDEVQVEIIVVDDASTDRTVEIAENSGCKVISHEKCRGQVAGKNTGLKTARGNYIMFHDGDDVMCDGAMMKMYRELEADDGVCAVMAKVQDFISPELSEEESKACVIKENPFYGLFTGAVLIRRSVFDAVGEFDETLNTGEIIAWQTELNKRGMKIKKVDFVSTNRRVHKSNYGKTDRAKEFKDYASALRARIR